MNSVVRAARWLLALPAGLLAGGIVWLVASIALDAFGIEFPNWLFFLIMAYAWLAAGFVFAGTFTKFAPAARTRVAQSAIGFALAGAVFLAARGEYGLAASLVFGLSLISGAVGYALRLRGFTESIGAEV